MYTCGWFMFMYGRSQHNIVKQLSPIKKNPAVFSCTGSLRKKYESQLFNNRVVLVQGFSWSYNTAWFFRLVTAPLHLQKLFTRLLLWLLVLLVVISHWLLVGGVSSLPLGCSHYGRLLSRKRGREKKHACKRACQNRSGGRFYNLISSVIYYLPVSSARCC